MYGTVYVSTYYTVLRIIGIVRQRGILYMPSSTTFMTNTSLPRFTLLSMSDRLRLSLYFLTSGPSQQGICLETGVRSTVRYGTVCTVCKDSMVCAYVQYVQYLQIVR